MSLVTTEQDAFQRTLKCKILQLKNFKKKTIQTTLYSVDFNQGSKIGTSPPPKKKTNTSKKKLHKNEKKKFKINPTLNKSSGFF